MPEFERNNLPYTPLFCEENIWQLARRMLETGADAGKLWVLFFSNPNRQLVMLNQQRAGPQGYVVWDYHVVLQAGELIYDFDTTLGFPLGVSDYFASSFPMQSALAERYRGWVRRIPAAAYVENLYSDRSHMRGVVDESVFPPWPAIIPHHDTTIPLSDYWQMPKPLSDGSDVLRVMDYVSLPRL